MSFHTSIPIPENLRSDNWQGDGDPPLLNVKKVWKVWRGMEKGFHHWVPHLIATDKGYARYGVLILSD